MRKWALSAAASALACACAAAGAQASVPVVTGLRFTTPPVIGRVSQLEVTTRAPGASVSGVSVAFGRGDGVFLSSACQAPDSAGRAPRGAFAPGATAGFDVPHRYTTGGARPLLLRVDAGGCSENGSTIIQQLSVTPTAPGQPLVPLVPGITIAVPAAGAPGAPTVPGAPAVPGAPTVPTVPGVPGGPAVPTLPGVPALPGLPSGLPAPVGVTITPPPLPAAPVPTPPLPSAGLPLSAAGRRLASPRRAGRAACPFSGVVPRRLDATALLHAREATLCLLNLQRRARHLRPLRENPELDSAAASHTDRMVNASFFAHIEPGGIDLAARLRRARYIRARHYWLVGENIGAGTGSMASPAALVQAWMLSTEHRANILDPQFREIGIGVARGVPAASSSGLTYTTDFGARG